MTRPLKTPSASPRLLSLDALRGFDMLLIMGFSWIVADICHLWPGAVTDWIAVQTEHAAWHGFTLYDTIFPLFLFIAGISFPFSLSKQRASGLGEGSIAGRVIRRGVVLVLLGLVYNGLLQFHFDTLRVPSVLGRIGLAWMFAALIFMLFGLRTRIVIAAAVLVGYGLLLQFVAAPDMPGADSLSPEGNIVGYVDRTLLPGHIYRQLFDPEGLLSTVPAVVTAMLGMFTGEFIRHTETRLSGSRKALYMALAAAALLIAGLCWNEVLPVNKRLWTSSFVCVVAAYSLGMFALFYYLIDVRGWRRWTFFFRVIGVNSITIYLAQQMIDFNFTANYLFGGAASLCPSDVASIVVGVGSLALSWLFLWVLDRYKIYLKV